MTGARSRALAIGLVAAIFAAGLVSGVLVDRLWLADEVTDAAPRGLPLRALERRLHHLSEELELTDDQVAGVREILARLGERAHAIHQQAEPGIRALQEEGRVEIRALLTPEQATKYDELVAEMLERFRMRRRRFRDGKGPPDRPPRGRPHGPGHPRGPAGEGGP